MYMNLVSYLQKCEQVNITDYYFFPKSPSSTSAQSRTAASAAKILPLCFLVPCSTSSSSGRARIWRAAAWSNNTISLPPSAKSSGKSYSPHCCCYDDNYEERPTPTSSSYRNIHSLENCQLENNTAEASDTSCSGKSANSANSNDWRSLSCSKKTENYPWRLLEETKYRYVQDLDDSNLEVYLTLNLD